MLNSIRKYGSGVRPLINRLHRTIFIERCAKTLPYRWDERPKRYELINKIIARNGAQQYLEIGCRNDECFSQIRCAKKVGVDPASGGTLRMTSDDYFATHKDYFDVIFIDGLHLFEQVDRDMENSLARLNPGGVVLVHDCLPLNVGAQSRRIEQAGPWNGDVWKAFLVQRVKKSVDSAVCEIDHGVGVLLNRSNSRPLAKTEQACRGLLFSDLAENYKDWMNLKDFDSAIHFATGAHG